MKNVTQFYRTPRIGQFSIEQVFKPLKEIISEQFEIEEYFCDLKKNRFQQILDATKHQGNVNHVTGDVHFLTLGLTSKKTILTIHDLFHYENDLIGLRKKAFKIFWVDIPIKKVKIITTISQFTKEKLIEITGCSPEKIRVIHNSTSQDLEFSSKTFNSEKPIILQIGVGKHKNATRLIEAVRGISCKLLFIRSTLDKELLEKLNKYKIEYEWYSNLLRVDLINLYKKCDLLFFASEMEGFGVPIIEANQIGRPVITSNTTSMPEVAGNAAILVDPFKVDEIREAIIKLIINSELRNSLVEAGKININRFSAKVIGNQYCSLYSEIIEN